eukprot:TRINITY_DN309_c0_g2_i1.p1 TRINITY_DN309_c0_g2~~TRINITY_DN309_c0_g2_i1.p1  ORF type:complete len:307 (+),score=106.90 TRINITY_DN309_c0_g2_i1:82-921(+)
MASPPASPAGPRSATVAELAQTLVRYAPPIPKEEWEATRDPRPISPRSGRPKPAVAVPPLAPSAPPLGSDGRSQETLGVEEVLDALFPPKEEIGEGTGQVRMVRPVSREPASAMAVITLQEQLEQRGELRSVRENGICVQREELYEQCFDELIRQVTVACPERGLLLARIRDELRMTRDSYKALYEMACALGMRKVIQRDLDHEVAKEMESLEYEVQIQQKRVHGLQAKVQKTRKLLADRQQLSENQHEEEMRFIRKGNTQLTNELKRLQRAVESAQAQ